MKNSSKGWVRLHRQIEDNELYFSEPFTKAQAWIDLFLNANHKKGVVSIRGNIIEIKRGQIGWSELTMMKRWKWSRDKVRRFLKYLETIQQIIQKKDRFITTIITILNYDIYQIDTAERQQNIQQNIQQKDSRTYSRRYINKNDKNDKNDKKREGRFAPPSLEEVKIYCEERQNQVNSQSFIDFYASKGWMVGRNKMKDWRAAIRTWENRNKPVIANEPFLTVGNHKFKTKEEVESASKNGIIKWDDKERKWFSIA